MSDLPFVTRSEHDDVIVFSPVGEFDIAGTDLLRSAFTEALSASRCKLVVDLSATTFMDSMALGSVVGAGRKAGGWGGWLRLVAPPANIRRVLRITEIDTVLGLYDTVEEAIAHQAELAAPVD
jgi:anti-sigma B factor antagonist